MGGPLLAELRAECGEFADEFPQGTVVGLSSGLGAQQCDGGVAGGLPVDEEVPGDGVEEVEAGNVGAAVLAGGGTVEHGGVYGPCECVVGDDVHAAVAHEGGGHRHGVQQPLNPGRDGDVLAPCGGAARGLGGAGQVEEVGAFVVIQFQGLGDGGEDVFGDAADVALFQPGVPLGADAGEDGDFFAAQARDAASAAGGQPDLFGGDLGASAGKEVPDVGAVVGAVAGDRSMPLTVATGRP